MKRTMLQNPSPKAQRLTLCLEVKAEIAKDEGVLLAELIVRLAVFAVTGKCLSAGSQTFQQCCDLLRSGQRRRCW